MTDTTGDTTNDATAVRIERRFDAPVARVWQMWTEPEHFRAWYGPEGATIPEATLDVRVGGTRRVCMEVQTPDGPMRMWFTGEHVEVVENERLVYTESMADEDGTILSPAEMGMPEDHPTTTEVRVELDEDDGQTRMRLTHAGIPGDSPAATGWNMAFDKLTTHLATAA